MSSLEEGDLTVALFWPSGKEHLTCKGEGLLRHSEGMDGCQPTGGNVSLHWGN